MATDLTVPDPSIVVDLLQGFRRSKAMFAGVRLGVFDALSSGAANVDSLAQRLGCCPSALTTLLDALVGLNLLNKVDGNYVNTPVAATYLTTSSQRRMTGYINYSNDVMWKMWGSLEGAVREGSSRWKEVFGWDEPIFSSFFKTEEAAREFLMGMHGFGVMSSPAVVAALPLEQFQRLIDLGGATGHLSIAACQRYPHLKAVVFDLPQAVPLAIEITSQCSVADRIEVVCGDFFEDELPRGDLYALGRILHDWALPKIQVLLKRIYSALPAGGGVFIAEKMLADDKLGPSWAQMQSLNMLVCTEGTERTLLEYEALLMDAGFVNIVGCRTPTPIDGILGYKPS
ncbi:MAG: homocysteine methyltransferase [Planctomycetales bacterium]|nr:homocysteine methyltransferase [Planctomycetales bacterium]